MTLKEQGNNRYSNSPALIRKSAYKKELIDLEDDAQTELHDVKS